MEMGRLTEVGRELGTVIGAARLLYACITGNSGQATGPQLLYILTSTIPER